MCCDVRDILDRLCVWILYEYYGGLLDDFTMVNRRLMVLVMMGLLLGGQHMVSAEAGNLYRDSNLIEGQEQ